MRKKNFFPHFFYFKSISLSQFKNKFKMYISRIKKKKKPKKGPKKPEKNEKKPEKNRKNNRKTEK